MWENRAWPLSALSTISDDAIAFLSAEKLGDLRERYWLPCGREQFPELSIDAENEYPWVIRITPLHAFFSKGLVLRATSKSLDEDIPLLVREIRKHKQSVSEAQIEHALRQFYEKYSFEPRHESLDFWG